MTSQSFITTPQRLLHTAAVDPAAIACYHHREGNWRGTAWSDLAADVCALARALLDRGVQPGDRIAILAYNRLEWVIADLAIMMVGAVSVGLYFTAAPTEIAFILRDSNAVMFVLESDAQLAKLAPFLADLPTMPGIVIIDNIADRTGVTTWPSLIVRGQALPDLARTARLAAISPDDLGTLIYTSGTTGQPKAVGLTHGALSNCLDVLYQMHQQTRADRAISYLPLAHIAERMLSVHAFAAFGFSLYFAESVQTLSAHLPEVRPTIFFGVPRVWEKLSTAIEQRLGATTGSAARIAAWAQRVGRDWHRRQRATLPISRFLRVQFFLAHALVYRKVKAAIGLDAARLLISGAAPIAPETLEFLAGFDILVYELYGQSETCGPTSSNLPGANRLGSVGRAVPGTTLKIAEDGEVLVRDDKLFTGYIGRPDATAETLVDGWLHSGDLGMIDADGYLFITGRKKDLIITAGGKNIAPSSIEAELESLPLIEHGIVIGDRRPYLIALITLAPDAVLTFARSNKLDLNGIETHPLLRAEIQRAIDRINESQARVAQIRRFTILDRHFAVESGELTPTLKLRRSVVAAQCQNEIAKLYQSEPGDPL